MRVFIAINLPDNVKKALSGVISAFRQANQGQPIKWVESDLLHITMHFLGELEEADVKRVEEILTQTVLKYPKVKLKLENLGGFPNLVTPKIIFVKAKELSGVQIAKMQNEISRKLIINNFQIEDRNWVPHITIGRVKGDLTREIGEKGRAGGIRGYQEVVVEPIEWEVESVDLMESVLGPNGPTYKVLRKFDLK